MDRNSKEINLANLNLNISACATEPTLCATVHVQYSSHYTM